MQIRQQEAVRVQLALLDCMQLELGFGWLLHFEFPMGRKTGRSVAPEAVLYGRRGCLLGAVSCDYSRFKASTICISSLASS